MPWASGAALGLYIAAQAGAGLSYIPPGEIVWAKLPQPRAFLVERPQAEYPPGKVMLDCAVDPNGTLYACQVADEQPPNSGLGAQALRLSRLFVMKPTTRSGLPVGGRRVHVPIKFSVE